MRNGLVYTHGFIVDDVNITTAFYEKVLGYKVKRRTPTFVVMDTQSPSGLFFWEYAHICFHLGVANFEQVRHRAMLAMLFDTKEEVDERFTELSGDGMQVIALPQQWEWNAYAGYLVDPAGYLLELWTWTS